MKRVYLDHAATTPLLDVAREAMEPWLDCGNPSSNHTEGRRAKLALDEAREAFAEAFACHFSEVVFTGSATEAANLAIVGLALANQGSRKRIVMSAAEHHCCLNTAPLLRRLGFDVVFQQTASDSTVTEHPGNDTLAFVAMEANNETGAYNDVRAIDHSSKREGFVFICDVAQSFPHGWRGPYSFGDVLFAAPHKFGGPKGVGVMCLRAPVKVAPLTSGGGQERELRSGTENVAAIVGAAAALRYQIEHSKELAERKKACSRAFLEALGPHTPAVNEPLAGLPGTAFLWFEGIPADALLIRLDRAGIAASSGAACTSGSVEPSHVVVAAGFDEQRARECVRFSFGWTTTVEDAVYAGEVVKREVAAMRALKP